MESNVLSQIPGADGVLSWFSGWPAFHDAEVIRLELCRDAPSWLVLHVSENSGQLDDNGRFLQERGAFVSFEIGDISDLSLQDFSPQNVIASLSIECTRAGFKLTLTPSYGVGGWIQCGGLAVQLRPE